MTIEDELKKIEITPIYQTHTVQVSSYKYEEFEFVERVYYPGGMQNWLAEPKYFYSFWVGNKPVVYKNSITADDPYEENSFYIVFNTDEEMIEFLMYWRKQNELNR
jgi:hypothetical protein